MGKTAVVATSPHWYYPDHLSLQRKAVTTHRMEWFDFSCPRKQRNTFVTSN